MGFDINGFKNAFFSAMRNAGNIETKDSQINTEKEVKEAKNVQSAFKNQLANISDPIGDSFTKSNNTQAKGEFDEVSVNDLMALLDDTELNINKVNTYIEEKPVKADTKSTLGALGKTEAPKETREMAQISDADTDAVNFHTDMAIASGRINEENKQVESSEEGMDILGPKFYDAMMEALYENTTA